MTKIIAEIGWNHMGDIKLAKEMILQAKKNGALPPVRSVTASCVCVVS